MAGDHFKKMAREKVNFNYRNRMKELITVTASFLMGVIVGIAFDLADRIAEDRDNRIEAEVQNLTEMRVTREWELREGR